MAANFENAQLLKEALSILDGGQEKGALTVYNGDPNGNVTGTIGALCIDYSGSGKLWKNTTGSTTWVEVGGGGSSTFTGLTDTPSSYSGESLKAVRVNAGETALEFYTPSSSGSPYFDDDGGTPSVAPSAGATDSIAIGDGASVGATATGSLAIGLSSSVGSGSVHAISIGSGASIGSANSVSIAIGLYAQCTNGSNIAIGRNAKALTQAYSIAIGSGSSNTNASGSSSIAIGRQSNSTAGGSISLGRNAQSTANYSIAIGAGGSTSLSANATSNNAIAIGYGTDATNTSSISIGNLAQAGGNNGIAIGQSTSSSDTSTISIGQSATSVYTYAVAIGRSAVSRGAGGIVIGANSSIASASPQSRIRNNIVIGRSSSTTVQTTSHRNYNAIVIGYNAQVRNTYGSAFQYVVGGLAIGYLSKTYANGGIAIGQQARNLSGSSFGITIGVSSDNSGNSSIAIGQGVVISSNGYNSIGLGQAASVNVNSTIQVQATSIIRKDSGSVTNNSFRFGASNEAVVMTKEIDLKTTATTEVTVPTGSRFYPNEVGIILTTLGGTITGQPDVSFGINGTNNKFVTQTTSSLSAIYERDVYTSLTTSGEATLTFTVNTAATGSADIKGRAYFKGMLVEIQ